MARVAYVDFRSVSYFKERECGEIDVQQDDSPGDPNIRLGHLGPDVVILELPFVDDDCLCTLMTEVCLKTSRRISELDRPQPPRRNPPPA